MDDQSHMHTSLATTAIPLDVMENIKIISTKDQQIKDKYKD
jgi:hypothetical protein